MRPYETDHFSTWYIASLSLSMNNATHNLACWRGSGHHEKLSILLLGG